MELLKNDSDFFTSVEKAFDEIDPKWRDYPGLLIIGSHTPTYVEHKIQKLSIYRDMRIPALGICFGMQLMAIEHMRSAFGIYKATSQEIDPQSPSCVIVKMSELRVGLKMVSWWNGHGLESHWHNYTLSDDVAEALSAAFKVYTSDDGIVEAIKLSGHPFYAGVQFHPEYQSSKGRPHPILKEFIEACKAAAVPPRV